MHKLIRYYHENKDKIWKIILMTILIVVGIHIVNGIVKRNSTEDENNSNTDAINVAQQNDKLLPSETIISGQNVSTTKTKSNIEIIENFIQHCNNNEIQEAYDLLSNDCKGIMFPNVQRFYDNYYKTIFTEVKSYDLDAWITYGNVTYKVKLYNDIMASGKVSENYIEDYYTVVNEDGQYRLNINKYIRKEELNQVGEKENIKITILNRRFYMQEEIYQIKVENNTNGTIMIDTKRDVESIFLTDNKGISHEWKNYELDNKQLIVEANQSKEIEVGFVKSYSKDIKTKKIIFSNIIRENNPEKSIKIEIGM